MAHCCVVREPQYSVTFAGCPAMFIFWGCLICWIPVVIGLTGGGGSKTRILKKIDILLITFIYNIWPKVYISYQDKGKAKHSRSYLYKIASRDMQQISDTSSNRGQGILDLLVKHFFMFSLREGADKHVNTQTIHRVRNLI